VSKEKNKFLIRESFIEDSDEISKILVQSWKESYKAIFPQTVRGEENLFMVQMIKNR
jgi:hypothetical protein